MINQNFDLYKAKYLKYKTKYLTLQNILGGAVKKAGKGKVKLFNNNEKISDDEYYYINKDKIKSEIQEARVERKKNSNIPFTLTEMEKHINKNHVNREGVIQKIVKEEADEKIKEEAGEKIKEEINPKKKTEEKHTNENISDVDYYYTNKYIIKSVIRSTRHNNYFKDIRFRDDIENVCNNLYPNRKVVIRKIINEDTALYDKLLEEHTQKVLMEKKQKEEIEKKQKEEIKKKQKEERIKNNLHDDDDDDDDDIDFNDITETRIRPLGGLTTAEKQIINDRTDKITVQMIEQDEKDKIAEKKVSEKQRKELEELFKEIEKQLSSEEKLAKEKMTKEESEAKLAKEESKAKLAKLAKEESEKKAKLAKEESEKKAKLAKEESEKKESICKEYVRNKKLNSKDLNALKYKVLKKLEENYGETDLKIENITDIDICDFDNGLLEPIQIVQQEEGSYSGWISGAIPS